MKKPVIIRQGEAEEMQVMGVGLRFMCGGSSTEKAWSLMETVIPEHAGPPPHHHPWDEAYYVVEGRVRFEIDGRVEIVGQGDFIYAPGGTVHAFQGASDQPARMLIFDAPAHTEAFFRDVHREVTQLPQDFAKVPAIGQRHDVHFLPPPGQ